VCNNEKKNCNDKKVKLLVVATLRCVAGKKNHNDKEPSFSSLWPWAVQEWKKEDLVNKEL
jgi:hypothetical protein